MLAFNQVELPIRHLLTNSIFDMPVLKIVL